MKHCACSVPSRLIGEWVLVRLFEERLKVCFVDELQMPCERLAGRNLHRVDYQHINWSLVRKPGHSSAMSTARTFSDGDIPPSVRRVADAAPWHPGQPRLPEDSPSRRDDDGLRGGSGAGALLESGARIEVDAAKALVDPKMSPPVPSLSPPSVDLSAYDRLLEVLARASR